MAGSAWQTVLLRVAAILAIVIGAGVFLITVAIGDCSAFGGACPPPRGVSDDVLVGSGVAGALMGAGLMLAVRPNLRAVPLACIVALLAGIVFAGLGHSMASS